MLPHITKILRSANAIVLAVNFTQDESSILVTEAVTVSYPRKNVGSEAIIRGKSCFSTF
jgi:hypothetical protein